MLIMCQAWRCWPRSAASGLRAAVPGPPLSSYLFTAHLPLREDLAVRLCHNRFSP